MIQVKTHHCHTEKQGFLATLGFQNKFQTRQLKPAEADPSFRKVNLLPAKLDMLFPAHL